MQLQRRGRFLRPEAERAAERMVGLEGEEEDEVAAEMIRRENRMLRLVRDSTAETKQKSEKKIAFRSWTAFALACLRPAATTTWQRRRGGGETRSK